jgi:bacillithiol system protein YtxJ
MNWNKLTHPNQIQDIKAISEDTPVLIFKHSTQCAISSMALARLVRKWQAGDQEKIKPYFLDLMADRSLSDAVAKQFGVAHQSPQVLVIKDGKVQYEASHYSISYADIMKSL